MPELAKGHIKDQISFEDEPDYFPLFESDNERTNREAAEGIPRLIDLGDNLANMLKRILGGSKPHPQAVHNAIDRWSEECVKYEED